ncbi:hypothetical protein H6F86_03410 [Phormidium sp. FACHB-592]|uniref:Uncharacterized protein n=1 Tax=Stenomitos frigidus AS-A4 TaxID=2933935 RepID=A0ABV0KTL3_9CYAN|nr:MULTISPECIES: hypothetical protein [Cyanophyceae]MBD2034367.1 hypothetical protein [Leptolyngbya sp. FACHB-321]MBD2072947.1 hypothetical protein [Phormidium sp. FACHB-592]
MTEKGAIGSSSVPIRDTDEQERGRKAEGKGQKAEGKGHKAQGSLVVKATQNLQPSSFILQPSFLPPIQ